MAHATSAHVPVLSYDGAMPEPDVSDLLVHLANGSLESANPRVVDVIVVLADASTVAGYPSRVSIGRSQGLTLTPQGATATMGDDAVIDPSSIVWACARSSDGSSASFGTPAAQLSRALAESLAEAKRAEPRGADAARLSLALAAVAHGSGDLRSADRYYRSALGILAMIAGGDRELGDAWARLASVYRDLGDGASRQSALGQAAVFHASALGEDHPITRHTRASMG